MERLGQEPTLPPVEIYVPAYYYICVRILRYMSVDTSIYTGMPRIYMQHMQHT
jgi:hypothetical protein